MTGFAAPPSTTDSKTPLFYTWSSMTPQYAINNNKNPFNVDKKGEATEIQSESEKELLKVVK